MGASVIDFEGDAIGQFVTSQFNSTGLVSDASSQDIGINRSVIAMPEKSTTETSGSTFLEILNSLDLAFDAINIILNIAFAPLILFQIEGIPYMIAFIIAIPMVILFWMSIIQFIRGAS